MRWIAGGRFRVGSDLHDAEEALVRTVALDAFWTDETPVTNRQFKRFPAP
jgi:sulfatase modifying factor 1